MSKALRELKDAVTKLEKCMTDMRTANADDFGDLVPLHRASPARVAFTDATLLHYSAVATLECVFEEILNARDAQRMTNLQKKMLARRERAGTAVPDEAQSTTGRPIIWPATLSEAIQAGLISKEDAAALESAKPWDRKDGFTFQETKRTLCSDLAILKKLTAKAETELVGA